ncbi:hypothetical protein JAAARDRAFT_661011 [Jaapia argillacea MUCL 33604]|uniref:Uncharacterized protein n=1 Tax=Jaapia argillacea MUCL 33604 TaxID=933084 RepID=A0A067P314_9AGAM|nr:hypothetical protein JAAARDRAFT_661011 [Jaapia argillacea MUCL 33604]
MQSCTLHTCLLGSCSPGTVSYMTLPSRVSWRNIWASSRLRGEECPPRNNVIVKSITCKMYHPAKVSRIQWLSINAGRHVRKRVHDGRWGTGLGGRLGLDTDQPHRHAAPHFIPEDSNRHCWSE